MNKVIKKSLLRQVQFRNYLEDMKIKKNKIKQQKSSIPKSRDVAIPTDNKNRRKILMCSNVDEQNPTAFTDGKNITII
ncbi:MAG: hypothetical protein LBF08_01360 [Dysgonamonadaceae bacterium]|jgi:hypothetical protein|nr:hypothetical protein [Dysgonamonadaceae bacterium]